MKEDLDGATSTNSKRYSIWQQRVFDRDKNSCQRCGTTTDLCAHHIIRWRDSEELRFELSNGLTVCRACHVVIHAEMGDTGMKGRNHSDKTKEQIRQAKIGQRLGIKMGPMSQETKDKISKSKTGFKMGSMPQSQREKIRIANTGKSNGSPSPETLEKMRAAHAKRSHINGAQYRGKTWIKCQETGKRIWVEKP